MAVESADPVLAARSLARMRAIARVVPEPRLQWTLGLYETFEATMAGRLEEAERIAAANLDVGLGDRRRRTPSRSSRVRSSCSAPSPVVTDELLPLVEQAAV